jgi:hypothetical protein
MSGDIEFSDTNTLSPSGWAWRTLIDFIRQEQPGFPELAGLLSRVTEETGHWNLLDASVVQLHVLRTVLKKILDRLIDEGSRDWHDPQFFPGFMVVLGQLMQAVVTEIHVKEKSNKAGR